MAKILNFENLQVWQKSQDLVISINECFENVRNFSFKDQIFRAALSISNNIAEGFDRSSDGDFLRFLKIANGSASEVKSMIYLSLKLGYISEEKQNYFLLELTIINKMLNSLIKSIQETSFAKNKK